MDASDAVRDKDLGEMVGAVTDFSKRNPVVFLGSAALIGFAATRFARASGDSSTRSKTYGQRGREMERADTADRSEFSSVGDEANPAVATPAGGAKL